MLKTGGHYIGITPVNNLMGHGFYQFSPELYYNIFCEDNGFTVVKMVMYSSYGNKLFSDWYEVMNPKSVRSRVMFTNSFPTYLMVLAKKICDKNIFSRGPQQSDYETLWAAKKSLEENKSLPGESKLRFIGRKFLPRQVKDLLRKFRGVLIRQTARDDNFGVYNPEHFKKINIG